MLNHVALAHAQFVLATCRARTKWPASVMASQPSGSSPSILECLKAPNQSDLVRKQRIEGPKTTGVDKRRKSGASNQTNPKTVSPADHVKEFSSECLEVRHKKLLCGLSGIDLAKEKYGKESYLLW